MDFKGIFVSLGATDLLFPRLKEMEYEGFGKVIMTFLGGEFCYLLENLYWGEILKFSSLRIFKKLVVIGLSYREK